MSSFPENAKGIHRITKLPDPALRELWSSIVIDKKTKDAYNPIIERGRYNCRHFINWITKELAEQLRPDLKK